MAAWEIPNCAGLDYFSEYDTKVAGPGQVPYSPLIGRRIWRESWAEVGLDRGEFFGDQHEVNYPVGQASRLSGQARRLSHRVCLNLPLAFHRSGSQLSADRIVEILLAVQAALRSGSLTPS